MKKTIKKWGNNLVVVFTKEDENCYELNEADIVDIELVKQKRSKK